MSTKLNHVNNTWSETAIEAAAKLDDVELGDTGVVVLKGTLGGKVSGKIRGKIVQARDWLRKNGDLAPVAPRDSNGGIAGASKPHTCKITAEVQGDIVVLTMRELGSIRLSAGGYVHGSMACMLAFAGFMARASKNGLGTTLLGIPETSEGAVIDGSWSWQGNTAPAGLDEKAARKVIYLSICAKTDEENWPAIKDIVPTKPATKLAEWVASLPAETPAADVASDILG